MKLIVGNWKMLPESLAQAQEILDFSQGYLASLSAKNFDVVYCPPFVFIEEVAKMLKAGSMLGAQDIAIEDKAALTGEVSGPMLKQLGVRYVIIGHSERRWKLGEDDEVTNKKLKSALRNGLTPIVCIGERVRDDSFKAVLGEQIAKTFEGLTPEEVSSCTVAYEPVWAISTNPGAKPDTPSSALESINIILNTIVGGWKLEVGSLPKVLYGGSITPKNAADFLRENDINGVLIGGSSVKKEEFVEILKIAFQL